MLFRSSLVFETTVTVPLMRGSMTNGRPVICETCVMNYWMSWSRALISHVCVSGTDGVWISWAAVSAVVRHHPATAHAIEIARR